jgi:hypothetical protein
MVMDFGTQQDITYPYCSITGMYGYITAGVSLIFTVF